MKMDLETAECKLWCSDWVCIGVTTNWLGEGSSFRGLCVDDFGIIPGVTEKAAEQIQAMT